MLLKGGEVKKERESKNKGKRLKFKKPVRLQNNCWFLCLFKWSRKAEIKENKIELLLAYLRWNWHLPLDLHHVLCFKIVCWFPVMWQLLGWWWDHVKCQPCAYLERVGSQHPGVDGDFFCSNPQQLLDDNSESLVQPRAPHRGIAGCLGCREVRSRVLGRDQLVWRKTGHRSAKVKKEQRSH